ITQKNIELAKNSPEFNKRHEKEQKFLTANLEHMKNLFEAHAMPIEQVYLSSPEDEFSLRVRKHELPHGTEYTATLKDRGLVTDGALNRLEVSTPISETAYEYFTNNPDLPRVRKERAEPYQGVTIDFIEGADF